MICIYSQNNTNYQANGDAVLEPMSCDLEITINGAWSLTLEHPYDPEGKYKYIVEGAVIRADIRCIRELTGVRQLFRVYDYKKGLHSVTAIAFPVAMEATYDAPIDNLVIQNKTGSQAMTDLQAFTNKYTLATDITKVASSSFANTNVNSAIASGSNNCFLKIWGGEILYDNLTFNVKSRIGDSEAGDHQITYGHNLTDITYTKDDSGLITRIYPISQDGIRLNGSGYVDSPKISDYPVIHSHFIQAPYTLINTDAASPSQTAQQTRTSGAAVNTSANTLALSSYNTALAAGYEPEYIKGIRQEIIQAVQTMALASVISTSLYNYLSGIISNAMSFMSELEQPAWDWMGSWEDGWKYGNENGYAVSRYVKIGKTWSYFNVEGYWEEPRDDSGTWDWYQAQADPGRRYGNFTHYYAHNENVYITMSGTLTKYYFDSDGWYDDSKTEASTWDWHGSGTASDPYWFGESGATSEESNKYAHDCWLFIDGSLYFFDHFGYYTPGNKFADYQWDWVETSDGFWFGNAIDQTYGAVYLKSQWAKINGDWIYFDENGYAVQENASQSAAVEVFTTGMAGLKTVVDAQTTILYDLLYSLMTQYANSRYAAGVDVPAVTITVDMADLSKTTEYAGFENLETVKLGDAVICTDNEHNISMTSRVIGLTYDCIRDYNSTVVIGKASASISSIVGNANSEVVTGGFDTTALEAQIAALQGKVGDIFMNDASIVSNGVGRFAIQPGENISISRAGNTLTISGKGGSNIYYGTEEPAASLGVDRDLYCKLGDLPTYIVDSVEYNNLDHNALTKIAYNEFSGNMSGVQVATSLHDPDREYIYLDGLIKGNTYTLTVKCTLTDGIIHRYSSGSYANNYFTVTDDTEDFSNPPIIILDDTFNTEQTKSSTFVAKDTNILVFAFWAMQDGHNAAITCSSIKIEGNFRKIVKIYDKVGNGWVDYEGGESYTAGSNIDITNNVISGAYQAFTGTDGTEDGISGLVPQPLTTDAGKFLKSDGTWAEVQGGGGTGLIQDAQIYSFEEKQIGVWVDGRPLYQKTFIRNITLVSGSWVTTGDSILNGKAIDAEITKIDQISDTVPVWCEIGADGHIELLNIRNTGQITITHYTVRYFKTTDTAGSGGFQAYGFTPIIYSTEEREVGVWTDGKPLYQKTFDCGTLLNAQTKEVSFTEDMETATIIDAFAMSTSEGYVIPLPDVVPNYVAGSVRIYVSKTAKKIYIYSQADMRTYDKSYVTIQYTKTTDVAGSAQYTTLGVPAVHYDGNEKIVGTYYGETLYEKSYIQQLNNGETQISISDLNANYAFIESGFYDIGVTKLALNEIIDVNSRLYTYTHINTGSQYLNIDCKNTVSATSTIHITIRYTKTS